MKKYFVVSDIHSFYKPMMTALRKAGFRKSDPNHVLIVCGDVFDRGPDSVKVYKFLRSLPKQRRVLIRGNHEYLLRDAINRGYFESHDYSNGTQKTVKQFLNYYYPGVMREGYSFSELFLNLGILRWIFSDEWVNYYEVGKYVFVHSWIPVNNDSPYPLYYSYDYSSLLYNDEWRSAQDFEWEDATWGCPWMMYKHGLFPQDKTIVCGHWHTSDFRVKLDKEDPSVATNEIYIKDHVIGLDACTVISGFCNVFTFEDEEEV